MPMPTQEGRKVCLQILCFKPAIAPSTVYPRGCSPTHLCFHHVDSLSELTGEFNKFTGTVFAAGFNSLLC